MGTKNNWRYSSVLNRQLLFKKAKRVASYKIDQGFEIHRTFFARNGNAFPGTMVIPVLCTIPFFRPTTFPSKFQLPGKTMWPAVAILLYSMDSMHIRTGQKTFFCISGRARKFRTALIGRARQNTKVDEPLIFLARPYMRSPCSTLFSNPWIRLTSPKMSCKQCFEILAYTLCFYSSSIILTFANKHKYLTHWCILFRGSNRNYGKFEIPVLVKY